MTEHLVLALWGPKALDETLVERLGVDWVQINVYDAPVADGFRMTAFDEPADAFLTLAGDATPQLDGIARRVEGWRVQTESPIVPPAYDDGVRADCFAQIAVLRCPAELAYDEWLRIWKDEHTPIGIADQGNVGYVQHRVLERLTPDAPDVAAIVEELFPMAGLTDPHAFYGSGGDDAELSARMGRMFASIQRFGADRDIDVVPTSRYRFSA